MTTRKQGFSAEPWGDPFGLGGPLYVVRARAVESQTVRIVFDEEPLHFSPAAKYDALNPSNYSIVVVSGSGTDPQVVKVKEDMITGPVIGVESGDERGFDLQTDRPLSPELLYEVTATRIKSKLGGTLGAPYKARFAGMFSRFRKPKSAKTSGYTDIENALVTGQFVVDGSGDLAKQDALASLKKRILRRCSTPKDAYSFLPGYGVRVRLKEPMSLATLASLRSDLMTQVKLEPEVADVAIGAQLNNGFALFTIKVTLKTGALLDMGIKLGTEGVTIA